MKRGKYLEGGSGLQSRGKRKARPARQYPNSHASLPWPRVAMAGAFRPYALNWPVVHIGRSLQVGTFGEACFPVVVVAYLAQAVLREWQW